MGNRKRIADRLNEVRRHKGLTLRQIAQKSGVNYKKIQRWFSQGADYVQSEKENDLRSVCRVLGIDYAWLWEKDGQITIPSETIEALLRTLEDFKSILLTLAPQRLVVKEKRQPDRIVKWWGSKHKQATEILRHFPSEIETYFEPFLGGASLLLGLLLSDVRVKRFRCSDNCVPLIGVWNLVKSDPNCLFRFYDRFWNTLGRKGCDFYFKMRERFNKDRDPLKFFALLSTCRNGYVRFNNDGELNSSFHYGRRGIRPARLRPLLDEWSARLNAVDVQFEVKDFASVESAPGDFLYLDPPYSDFDFKRLWRWLEKQRGSYSLSLGGLKGDEDRRIAVPPHLYDEAFFIESPNAFHRMAKEKLIARDSLYVRRPSFSATALKSHRSTVLPVRNQET
jgi:DNA adenine methylase